MSDRSVAISPSAIPPAVATGPTHARPVPARTKLLLEGPVLPTLLRLSAPNILNLLAIAGMITFAGGFCAYATLASAAMFRVTQPSARPKS
jgi:hypothetical protein